MLPYLPLPDLLQSAPATPSGGADAAGLRRRTADTAGLRVRVERGTAAMNTRLLVIVGVVLVAAGILLTSSFFIVDQTEQALVLQLGEVRRVIREPGLKMKRPFIEDVITYDKRVLDFEPPHEEVIVSDQKRLVVDAYTRYRIINPLLFYQTVGTEAGSARPAFVRSSPAACAACSAMSR